MAPIYPLILAAKHVVQNPTGDLLEPTLTREESIKADECIDKLWPESSSSIPIPLITAVVIVAAVILFVVLH